MKINSFLIGSATLAIGLHEISSKEKHPHIEEKSEIESPRAVFPINVYNIGMINQNRRDDRPTFSQLTSIIG